MKLFEPWQLRDLKLRNRTMLSPMCQYSATAGHVADWHLVHLGARAYGGFGMLISEAVAVSADGRISYGDLGIWSDEFVAGLHRLTDVVHGAGAAACIQLAHAGRKAAGRRPWDDPAAPIPPEHTWSPIWGPTAERFSADYQVPKALTIEQIEGVRDAFVAGARRAVAAGFDAVEIHAAHGYLLNEFLSPAVNRRTDAYGGDFAGRTRLLLEVTEGVREAIPQGMPLLTRISAIDWLEDGWQIEDSVRLSRELKARGVDLIDCSSGGARPDAAPVVGPGYRTAFAARVRAEAEVPTGAVGLITGGAQADHVVRTGQADAVLIGRAALRDPYWPLHAAHELGEAAGWPAPYLRGRPR